MAILGEFARLVRRVRPLRSRSRLLSASFRSFSVRPPALWVVSDQTNGRVPYVDVRVVIQVVCEAGDAIYKDDGVTKRRELRSLFDKGISPTVSTPFGPSASRRWIRRSALSVMYPQGIRRTLYREVEI